MEFSKSFRIFAVYMQTETDFEIYYSEVLSFLDDTVLPDRLFEKIEPELRECIYVFHYKHINDSTAATMVSAFITTFKKFLK